MIHSIVTPLVIPLTVVTSHVNVNGSPKFWTAGAMRIALGYGTRIRHFTLVIIDGFYAILHIV